MKKTNRKEQVYTIQPGEAKTTNNWLRDNDDFDIEAFPWLFSDGKYGLNYKREKPLTPVKYFASKVMNKNAQFAQDADFVFVAQQFVERYLLEGQIDVATRKGSINRKDGKLIQLDDGHDIFKKIPGTPAYWHAFRSEIFARMEQLGHFHLFYTLSCAEMKWPEIFAEIFKELGFKVVYPAEDWDGSWSAITVEKDGKVWPLDEFKEKYLKEWQRISVTNFLKDHCVLITRIFDERVKNFVKNVLKKKGISG